MGAPPRFFLTKTWGWSPETHPTLGFSTEGGRTKYLREATHGDWIVIAGTKGRQTDADERGRLLGMCRVGRDKVDAAEIMAMLGTELTKDEKDENGRYRWRWAMPIVEAVRFDPQPDTEQVLGSYLPGQDWANYAIEIEQRLGRAAVDAILDLPRTECEIASIPVLDREKVFAETLALQRRYGPSGPPPSPNRSASDRELGLGHVYAFALVGGKVLDVVKIGSSSDPDQRLAQLNAEIRPHLTGCRWKPVMRQVFPSETYAYRFEQLLLAQLRDRLVEGDREVVAISRQDLDQNWIQTLAGKKWTTALE